MTAASAPLPPVGAAYLAQDFGGQVHEAQHVALIPGVKHAEVVGDVVGALHLLG